MASTHLIHYHVSEVCPYIDWVYFFHAWHFQPKFAAIAHLQGHDEYLSWLNALPEDDRTKAHEATSLLHDAQTLLNSLYEDITVDCLYRLCNAYSENDNLLLDGITLPLLRQQTCQANAEEACLCLSDFVRPVSSGTPDKVGLFASSIDTTFEQLYADDPYKLLLIQTLNDRLVEAGTERMHMYLRKEVWKYAEKENLSIAEILSGKFQGIRPAVGYPSLPDQSIIFLLDDLLDMKQIGITLTENGAMHPHASTAGIIIAHPKARYFSVGKIGNDQLNDYARRRGMPVEQIRQFLLSNIPDNE